VFYEDDAWIAFLAAPFHTRGHSIVAAQSTKKEEVSTCPRVDILGWDILKGFDSALALVSSFLMERYRPKDILFASVRGDISHFHCHLIPLWDHEEKAWRKEHLYERGHLLEYVGFLEKRGDERAALERIEKGWTREDQRGEITRNLDNDIKALQNLTGYGKGLTT